MKVLRGETTESSRDQSIGARMITPAGSSADHLGGEINVEAMMKCMTEPKQDDSKTITMNVIKIHIRMQILGYRARIEVPSRSKVV